MDRAFPSAFSPADPPPRPRLSPTEDLAGRTAAALWARLLLVRGRWRSVTAIEAQLLALVAGTAILALSLAVATLAGKSRGAFGLLWPIAAVPALGTALAMGIHRALQQRQLGRWAALRAIRHSPQTDGELLRSGIELAVRVRREGTAAVGSAWLVAATLAEADQQVAGLEADVAAIGVRCRRYGAWLLLLLLVGGLVRARAPEAAGAWFANPLPAEQAVREVGTLVGDVRLAVQPPAYAARAVQPQTEEQGETAALRGSKITVQANALPGFDVDAVELQAGTGKAARTERQPVATLEGRGQVFQTTLLDNTRYRFAGKDAAGNPVREAGWRELRTVADQPPKVTLTQPTGEIEVRPGQTLNLAGTVDDDLGLLQIELAIARGGTGGLDRRPLAVVHGSQHQDVREAVAVDSLQLGPGETALVQLEAADTNPFDGARKGVSDKLRVRMFSAERHHARALDQLRQLADVWALRLADRLERDPSQQKVDLPTALKGRGEMAAAEKKALDSLRAVRLLLGDDVQAKNRSAADLAAIEKAVAEVLGDEDRALVRLNDGAAPANDDAGIGESRQLYAVQRHHALVIAAEEAAVAALTDLAGDELEMALKRDARALGQSTDKLLDTLEKLAENNSAPLQAEAERLIDGVEQQLEKLSATAAETARLVPSEHLNARALQASSAQRDLHDQRAAMADVRRLLREGKVREAMERLRQMRDQMAAGAGNEGKTAEDQALDTLLQDLRRGIGRAQDGQGRVRDDLRGPAEEQARAQEEYFRKVRETALPQIGEMLQQARELLRPGRLASATAKRHAGLGDVRQALDAAQEAVDKGQLDQALQHIAEAQDGMAAVRRALQQEDDLHEMAKAAADGRRVDAAYDKLNRAAQKLREALPEPSELLRPATQGRLENLAEAQARIRLALERLRRKLGESGDAQPALQEQVGERIDHAAQAMRGSEDSLRRSDARRAFEQTAEALDALERARDMIRQGEGKGQKRSDDSQAVGMDSGEAKVDVGTGEANPQAQRYRQELLKAMQGKAPPSFKERLERYYKAIGR